MLMQALFFCAGCLRYAFLMSAIGLAVWLYWEDLEAIYSNSNILFLRKDAEILFFSGSGDLHFMVWGASMYKLWLRDLLPLAFSLSLPSSMEGKLFHARKLFRKFYSRPERGASDFMHDGGIGGFSKWRLCSKQLRLKFNTIFHLFTRFGN